jgi:hypothetical protein
VLRCYVGGKGNTHARRLSVGIAGLSGLAMRTPPVGHEADEPLAGNAEEKGGLSGNRR